MEKNSRPQVRITLEDYKKLRIIKGQCGASISFLIHEALVGFFVGYDELLSEQ